MKCDIEGVILRELKRFNDDRGWLIELFRHDEIEEENRPVMAYVSLTRPGVARGPHEHVYQSDYFAFIGPSTFRLYLWDNRKNSPTFGKSFKIDAGESNKLTAIIPPGVVHGYRNIGSVDGIVYNAPNRLYAGQGKKEAVDEIRHEDDPHSKYRLYD
ncbi:dTDP-4-dehydrorhamnose 3 5-epimerase and related enzymes-like protein [Candidatus Zixiibacteriota bacterium]|nr:dTDP-4-dehydrorhamnose 3 5-epimerase and related enzymes-like protein [candidate division Zixibacteria bacterium]